LAYAHERGILHRDIKPANILISEGGEPLLSDFGIAKLFEADQATALTGLGMAVGTPAYMAPEQWTGESGPQSDVYSMGVVLYEMLTGRPPYDADTPAAILLKQGTEPLPSPRMFGVDLPPALEHVLIKAQARGLADRYQDMKAFIGALENVNVGASMAAPPEEGLSEPTLIVPIPIPGTSEAPQPEQTYRQASQEVAREPEAGKIAPVAGPGKVPKRVMWIVGGVVLVLVLLCAASLGIAGLFSLFPATAPTATQPLASPTNSPSLPLPPTNTAMPEATPTQTDTPAPTSLPAEISDPNGVTMLLVPAGIFTMGSSDGSPEEQPVHEVYLDDFYLDKYEVTNVLYRACVDAGVCNEPHNTGSSTRPTYYGDPAFDSYPVIYVDWSQAKTYCEWRGARLPTEAEREKAARGTDGRTYPWGEGTDCSRANYSSCIGDTVAVGGYEDGLSPYGLYDMAGNVSEWVADWFGADYYATLADNASNPQGPNDGTLRGVRGGSWEGQDRFLRAYTRGRRQPVYNDFEIGIRCARGAFP
jgi:formylglycine-generating enzyme required for sulfatase activity